MGKFLSGNQLWRSPESWARAFQNTPSDVFSFGVVAIFVMLNKMLFFLDCDQSDVDAWWHILRRQISFFADEEGIQGLLRHIGEDDPFHAKLISVAQSLLDEGLQPFALWLDLDIEFRDLIAKMTNFNPAERITAREALQHPWFAKTLPKDESPWTTHVRAIDSSKRPGPESL